MSFNIMSIYPLTSYPMPPAENTAYTEEDGSERIRAKSCI